MIEIHVTGRRPRPLRPRCLLKVLHPLLVILFLAVTPSLQIEVLVGTAYLQLSTQQKRLDEAGSVMESGKLSKIDFKSLPEPGTKYKLGLKLGGGTGGEVYEAVESQTGKKVAIKLIELTKETEDEISHEYHILKSLSRHENFPEFYGIYLRKGKSNVQKIWLVLELCEGGTANDFARKLEQENKRTNELYIAYILRETIKAVVHLHENDICHRDVRGSNVLLTIDGKVKLADFGISRYVGKNKKMKTYVGSPGWLAPEVITSQGEEESFGYDKKADVWSIGITAIELGDGKGPFEDMHPGRALFQIVKNPPPTLLKPSDWSQLYNDFISECLIKDPENRPFVQELMEHTFFEMIDKQENLLNDLKEILESQKNITLYRKPDIQVRKGYMKTEQQAKAEKILQEDLAALPEVSEDIILMELHERFRKNEFYTFIGDILLALNPNKANDIYGNQYHKKYKFKGKSQNAPHIYSIAESAYRDVFHHDKPQHILFAGETGAGKTFNMMHAIDHLLFLGQGLKSSENVKKALSVIQALGNAATPHNSNSTRHILQTQLTFTDTGKISGGVFRINQLEKERVTTTTKKQANFHLFYYFYDTLKAENSLTQYHLNDEKEYRFLKAGLETDVTDISQENIDGYISFENNLRDLEFEEETINSIKNILAAIILIGEIEFMDDEDGYGMIATPDLINDVANLLGVDKKKFSWALINYCVIMKGEAVMRHNSKSESEEARNVLARGIYSRLVDWIVNAINEKLSIFRVIYGDNHVIGLMDLYGFECYKKNTLTQLFVNVVNEQLQFHYNQKLFTHDKKIAEEEGIGYPDLDFKDNKTAIDLIISKPDGLLCKIDEATRNENASYLIESLKEQKTRHNSLIFAETSRDFSIIHYTGKLTYDASEMMQKNRDFLPPELIETMRLSSQKVAKQLFTSLLTKSGNLSKITKSLKKQSSTSDNENQEMKQMKINPDTQGVYSQSRQMRTASAIFRSTCFDIFKNLSTNEFGFHFVRCIRTDLTNKPDGFQPEAIRQQLRAFNVVNTVLVTQQGYSYHVLHNEFIRRYKFLAFDFDENVEETKENCRLLLLRLKLEGWTLGKTKVFLKYFNGEYLSRLYERQIKKIVKVQSMMRTFIARRKLCAKIKRYQVQSDKDKFIKEEEKEYSSAHSEAAILIQRKYREYAVGNNGSLPLATITGSLSEDQKSFIRPWWKRWKTKSIFQVLLLYRADRLQALTNFCLQIHLYNQDVLKTIQSNNLEIDLETIDYEAEPNDYLPPLKQSVHKLVFDWHCLNLHGDTSNCEPLAEKSFEMLGSEIIARMGIIRNVQKENPAKKNVEDKEIQTYFDDSNQLSSKQSKITVPQEPQMIDVPTKNSTGNYVEEETNKRNSPLKEEEKNTKQNLPIVQKYARITKSEKQNDSEIKETKYRPKNFQNQQLSTKSQKIFKSPVKEMEEKFRRTKHDDDDDEEEPPFNFRAMLRKTNFRINPNNDSKDNLVFHGEKNGFEFDARRWDVEKRQPQLIVTEIAPGIRVCGQISEL